ncbi:MAG: hypothetical protein AAFN81_20610 [Bacteroidota bacterium]
MDDFLKELIAPFVLLLLGLVLGYVRARNRKTPIADFQEYLNYLGSIMKPALYAFLAMFIIFLGFGVAAGAEFSTALPRAIIAGLYTGVMVFYFQFSHFP